MRKAGVWAQYDADVKAAWDVLTNREDVSWRTDLKKIEYRTFIIFLNHIYKTVLIRFLLQIQMTIIGSSFCIIL